MKARAIIAVLALLMIISGCKQSNDVVGSGLVQKRKHRKGWFVNAGSHRVEQKRTAHTVNHTLPADLDHLRLPVTSLQGSVPGERYGIQRPGSRDHKSGTVKEPRHHPRVVEILSSKQRSTSEVSGEFPKLLSEGEEEVSETPQALSLIAKALAVFSGLMATASFISAVVLLSTGAALSSSAIFILIVMGAMSVVAILASLLLSYIILQRYDDDVPMQWTLFASYVFEAIIVILGYSFLFA